VWDDVPERYDSFQALLDEVHDRVRRVIDLGVEIIREDERLEPTVYPRPWLTVLSRGGVESGVDMTAGQPQYDPVGVTLVGVADMVNSLYAVQRLVYEDRSNGHRHLSLDELRRVLQADWEGGDDRGSYEALRQYVLHRLPRFGQDDPEINRLTRLETAHYAACFEGHETTYGGRFMPMIFGVATSILYGRGPKTGATPSGRKRGEMLAQSLQPSSSGAQGCTTEILRACAAVDFYDYPGGTSNVQECDPSLVQGEKGLDRLTDLVRGFFGLGGMELSLNFLTEEQLRAAQHDPDRYRYLMVRVFGLSAQFVNLSPELQETVIERVAAASRRPI
jgi:formate C-acetyltransferase